MMVLGPLDDQSPYLSEWDYILLRRKLDELLSSGRIRKIRVLKPVHPGIQEEWFQDIETEEIYRLVPPAERITPTWEKVDTFELFDGGSRLPQ